MSGLAEILVVAAIIGGALSYLLVIGYRRITARNAGCGSCGQACGGDVAKAPQVVQSIELLTVVTADDRR